MGSTLNSVQAGPGVPVSHSAPPKPIVRKSEQVIEFREGGGGLSLFGMPFLGAGLFMFLVAFGVIPMDGGGQWYAPILMSVFATAFTSVGAVLVFGRSWTVIDREAKTIVKAKGLVRPMISQRFDLRGYELVALQFEAGDSDSADQYPVLLQSGGGKNMLLHRTVDFGTAYQQAAYVASFLELPLEDTTTGQVRRLSPAELAASMPERLRSETGRREYVAQPYDLRSHVERIDGELRITIPPKPYRLWLALPALVPTAVLLYLAPSMKEFFDSSQTPQAVQTVIFGVLLLFFVATPLLSMVRAILAARFGYTRLTVNRNQFIFTERGVWSKKQATLELAEVVDIDFQSATAQRAAARAAAQEMAKSRQWGEGSPPHISPMLEQFLSWASKWVRSKGMTIKSKRGIRYFGAGLPDEEIVFLTHTVREWLRSR